MIEVTASAEDWPLWFDTIASDLVAALRKVPGAAVEHVGSTSVAGLAAKPVIDVDVIVAAKDVPAAIAALESIAYVHRGDLGVEGREAFYPPDDDPRRIVYVCVAGTLNVRNHLAVREVLRAREDLRDEYGAVKLALSDETDLDITAYIARKSAVLQKVLAASDLTQEERHRIWRLNDPSVTLP